MSCPARGTGAHRPVTRSPGCDEQKRCCPFPTCYVSLSPFHFPPFLKTAYRASSVARCVGRCVPLTICLGRVKWSPALPRLAAAAAGAVNARRASRPRCSRAGSKHDSSVPHNPRERGLLHGGTLLTPPAAESQQKGVVTGFDCSGWK